MIRKITAVSAAIMTLCTAIKPAYADAAFIQDYFPYNEIVSEYVSEYGAPELDEDGNFTGVYMRLLDFNNDGIDELYLVYEYSISCFCVEIYTIDCGEPVKVFGPADTIAHFNIDARDCVLRGKDNSLSLVHAYYDMGLYCWIYDFYSMDSGDFYVDHKIYGYSEGLVQELEDYGYTHILDSGVYAADVRRFYGIPEGENAVWEGNLVFDQFIYYTYEGQQALEISLNTISQIFSSYDGYTVGDVDFDSDIDLDDAVLALSVYARSAAGVPVLDCTQQMSYSSDIDCDGATSLDDAVSILSYYAQTSAGINISWADTIN